ncbi:MAG TPA: tRNA (N(6)-L-threonylcarbamoyladenosine(37)-C(2))-methylthiotransferase MtaB [Bacteroidaceae bacterium]|nr:tRNA (N(6)-L-threonylcarbamoyladenosine(37)-C(2))-methylthiotransferase MtaB [Bacteroidaceae bacterium]
MNQSFFSDKRVVFITLGCKLNFSETSTIVKRLYDAGVQPVKKGEKADICIINTCAVTEVAEKKSRQAINKIIRQNPNACVVVMGCYGQISADHLLLIPGVDIVIGQDEKDQVLELICEQMKNGNVATQAVSKNIEKFIPSCSKGDRTRFFLKVQDGCDYFCSYCIIPYTRGRSRNGKIEDIIKQAKEAGERNGQEIVLTGVNIGDFGKSSGEHFINLIQELDKIETISRYRISSIEPNLLTDEIIEFVAGSQKFMPHFHIPLQSGSDKVLELMHRRYDRSLFVEKIMKIKSEMPQAFIGVDVIVGMRGESDELFEDSYSFLESLDISKLHVFSYSERPGTLALKIPNPVSFKDKSIRSHRLIELSEKKLEAFYSAAIGKKADVLVERSLRRTPSHGFTDNYIKVELDNICGNTFENKIIKVRLEGFNSKKDALKATMVD